MVTVLPDCTALRLTAPVGPPGPVRSNSNAAPMPLGNVTASEKVTLIEVTIDRWAPPPLTDTDVTVGGAANTWTSKAPMSVAPPDVRAKPGPRWSLTRPPTFEPAL